MIMIDSSELSLVLPGTLLFETDELPNGPYGL